MKRNKVLLVPGILLFSALFIVPIIIVGYYSFFTFQAGKILNSFTLQNYVSFFTSSIYGEALVNTLELALFVTITCVLLGYPVAYVMARTPNTKLRNVIMMVVLLPLFVSVVVRTFGWLIILSRQGFVNNVLMGLGLISQPLKLILNFFGVYVGVTHVLLPFAILPIASSLQSIDRNLEEASNTLGAGPVQTFLRITLPLSLPGVISGSILTFALASSAYVSQSLLAGGVVPFLPVMTYDYAVQYLDWPLASAMALIMLLISLFLLSVYLKVTLRRR